MVPGQGLPDALVIAQTKSYLGALSGRLQLPRDPHAPMRARAGDPPRTMAQKILSARSGNPTLAGDMVRVTVDQIVLSRAPLRAFAGALDAGLKKTSAEVAIAYDGRCIPDSSADESVRSAAAEMLSHGVLVARAGVGFPAPVHLERFASPARLCVTDEPRLASVGGIGMLTLVVPTASLAQALTQGNVLVRPPVSVQVLLGGRLRPFVCARDVALELLRRGLGDVVRRVEEARGAPWSSSSRGRARVSCRWGSAASWRRSRRRLAPPPRSLSATSARRSFCETSAGRRHTAPSRRTQAHLVRRWSTSTSAPSIRLLLDELGQVRVVRDLAGQPVTQTLLGGDGGATLRDLFAAATLLKSKRVPSRLDFLLATPSRQMLEVLAAAGALTDLIATGARLVEPDARVVSGGLYPPPRTGVSMRTCDPEPRVAAGRSHVVASAETLAYAVAAGEVGDPRAFKRPVRVTVPRALPTDDVLIARKAQRGDAAPSSRGGKRDGAQSPGGHPWKAEQTLVLMEGAALSSAVGRAADAVNGESRAAVVCATLDEVRDLSGRALEIAPSVGAVLAPFIPSGLVALFSAAGIAAIRLDAAAIKGLKGQRTIALPAPSQWLERGATTIAVGAAKLPLTWLALGAERLWATGER